MTIPVSREASRQPPMLAPLPPNERSELSVAIAGLALGGAERIVLDWAARTANDRRVHLIVLRDHRPEWQAPAAVRVTRLHGRDVLPELRRLGRRMAAGGNPVCLCHLLRRAERDALAAGGAFAVPVLHNAREGWLEEAAALGSSPLAIAVSRACANDLRRSGWREGAISVIHHLPAVRRPQPGARLAFRQAWNIPAAASVIGMIGAVKPQKGYPLALQLLHALLPRCDAFLVIVGGPIGRDGRDAWQAILAEIERLGLRHRVAMPGFLEDAARCLPAFDVVLNTSHYEGLSIATLEALVSDVPVVASRVGGQGEVEHPGLTLLAREAPQESWLAALSLALASRSAPQPQWQASLSSSFPSYRLWTLAGLARPFRGTDKVLFVTANLNAGGAQRSLVNLAKALAGRLRFEVAVTGDSTAEDFWRELRRARVAVNRSGLRPEPFDHAETLVERICTQRAGTVCFWNVDPKIKLLLVKTLGFTGVRFVDVSPGLGSFEEMRGAAPFQRRICFDEAEYYARLDSLVLKYDGPFPPSARGKVTVIPNGVSAPAARRSRPAGGPPRVVVSGRIAPAKHLLETVAAMRAVWPVFPAAELHVFGAAEPRHQDYAHALLAAAGSELDRRVFFHGADFATPSRLAEFDVCAVIGEAQGCPNSILEALAAGLPVVANDDGGTRELIIHEETGLLIPDRSPAALAAALLRVLGDAELARRLGRNGRAHVCRSFPMAAMVRGYIRLFDPPPPPQPRRWLRRLLEIRGPRRGPWRRRLFGAIRDHFWKEAPLWFAHDATAKDGSGGRSSDSSAGTPPARSAAGAVRAMSRSDPIR